MVIIIFSFNLNSTLALITLFIILFWIFWMNIGYTWHRIGDKHSLSFFLGFKILISSLRRVEVKPEFSPVIQPVQRKIFLWLILRWLLFVMLFPYILISFLSPDNYNLIVFVLLIGLANLCGVIIEIEMTYLNQGHSGFYGRTLAIYELLALFAIVLLSWDLQSFSFTTMSQNIWMEDSDWKLVIQVVLLLIILFSLSLSSDYLGYKGPAPFDIENHKMNLVPLRLRTLYSTSQSFYQIIVILFLAYINLNFVLRFFSNPSVDVSIGSAVFLVLCLLFSISVLILSSLSYKLKFVDFGIYLPLLVVGIVITLIIIYLSEILPIIRIS